MKIINTVQGSAEWLAMRAGKRCASDAPIIMGESKYKTRDQYIHERATGAEQEHNEHTQRLFAKGHDAESSARVIIEEQIGEDLFPATCMSDCEAYLASVDGMTMDGSLLFEHKLLNDDLRKQIAAGELSPMYYWQLEHQFLVTGAERALFVASDGTAENMLQLEYNHVPERRDQLIKAWVQVEADIAAYQPPEATQEAVGVSPESLPALSVQVTGMVTASNLDQFREHALAVIESINTDLQTDSQFADAELAIKWCKTVEERLTATKAQVLGQMASIDEVCRTLDSISETTRQKRLMLDKLVKSQKEQRRGQIVGDAKLAWSDYMKGVNAQFDSVSVEMPCPDFATAIKGKKTLSSIQSACNDLLAQSKIAAMEKADLYRANLKVFSELAENHGFLFRNLQQMIDQPAQAFEAIIKSTIADYEKEQEAKRKAEQERMEAEAKAKAEAEREKIRREEQAKAEAEQRRIAEQERKEREQSEADDRVKLESLIPAHAPDYKPEPEKPTLLDAEAKRIKPGAGDRSALVTQKPAPSFENIINLMMSKYSVSRGTAIQWFIRAANDYAKTFGTAELA